MKKIDTLTVVFRIKDRKQLKPIFDSIADGSEVFGCKVKSITTGDVPDKLEQLEDLLYENHPKVYMDIEEWLNEYDERLIDSDAGSQS